MAKISDDQPLNSELLQFGGQTSAEINLININNQQFIGDLYMGTPMQKMSMIFDSGSSYLYVITDKC